jgi:hypothetical protein
VRRHEALRTSFPIPDGEPIQVVAPALNLSLPVVEVIVRPESEREREARRLASEEVRRPFDLAQGPLFRATLIRLSEEDHVLVLVMHHIASDGWSISATASYRCFTGHSSTVALPLAELPIQYADFAVWQREWLQGEVLEDSYRTGRNSGDSCRTQSSYGSAAAGCKVIGGDNRSRYREN